MPLFAMLISYRMHSQLYRYCKITHSSICYNEIGGVRLNMNMNQSTTKPTKCHVHPAKTQISLGICPVLSVFAVRMRKHLGA